jgi:hypothetical protein
MGTTGGRITLALAIAVLLVTAGCTGSDVIPTGNFEVFVEVEVVNTELIERDYPNTGINGASLKIVQMTIRPTNPEADASLGDIPIGVFTESFLDVDLVNPTPVRLTRVLSAGEYIINSISLRDIVMRTDHALNRCEDQTTPCNVDSECAGIGGGTCVLDALPCGDLQFYDSGQFNVLIPNPGTVFLTEESNRIRVTIDAQVLTDTAVLSHQPFCLFFNPSIFRSVWETYITVSQP